MEVSFSDLKEKEIINVYDGKKLGHIIDILFDHSSGVIQGIVVPGGKKLFKKSEDIFIPLVKLKKIGDDVILVTLNISSAVQRNGFTQTQSDIRNQQLHYAYSANKYKNYQNAPQNKIKSQSQSNYKTKESFVRFKPVDSRKYK